MIYHDIKFSLSPNPKYCSNSSKNFGLKQEFWLSFKVITKVLEYKVSLKTEELAMCSLVMNLCSRDLIVMSLYSSRLTVVYLIIYSAWFLDGKTSK